MAEGTSAFLGRGVGLRGNYEIQGDNDTDDTLSITGASSSAAGDVFVVQNSTGTEFLVVSASGLSTIAGSYGLKINTGGIQIAGASSFAGAVTIGGGLAVGGSATYTAGGTLAVSASTQAAGVVVNISSTGAITTGDIRVNGFLVNGSSKSVMTSAFAFNGLGGDGTVTCQYLLAIHGSKAPAYLLGVGTSTAGVGTIADTGFIDTGLFLTSALATTVAMVALKVLLGDSVWVIPLLPSSAMAAS